mgnify:FL=1
MVCAWRNTMYHWLSNLYRLPCRQGFDKFGYNRAGFDKDGYDKNFFDKTGYNK